MVSMLLVQPTVRPSAACIWRIPLMKAASTASKNPTGRERSPERANWRNRTRDTESKVMKPFHSVRQGRSSESELGWQGALVTSEEVPEVDKDPPPLKLWRAGEHWTWRAPSPCRQ